MSWFLRHPSYSALNRFADGELDPREHGRVAQHLADCSRCRAEVIFIRNAGELARSPPPPPAVPAGILDRVLERRDEGERALLPPTSPGARAERRTLVPLVATIFALLVAGLFTTGLLDADTAGLRIEPTAPRPGDTLAIEYPGDPPFADRSLLRLRARLYSPHDAEGELAEWPLRRDGDVFRGRIAFPDSVVFAVLAVEDRTGERLDSNLGALWPVLVHDDGGRPTADAMAARVAHFTGTDPGRAARAAIALADAYPEAPRSATLRLITELYLFEPAAVVARNGPVLDGFRRRLDAAWEPSVEERAWLAMMALTLGDPASAESLLGPVDARELGEPVVRDVRSLLASARLDGQPDRLLAALDSVWAASPVPVRSAADAGLRAALRIGSREDVLLWLPRYRRARPAASIAHLVERLAESLGPGEALAWALRDRADPAAPPADRPLTVSRSRHLRSTTRAEQRALSTMAGLALSTGRDSTARGLAAEALELAWSTAALGRIGEVLFATGDTAGGRRAFARAAADPVGPEPPPAVTRLPDWPERLAGARSELIRYVLRDTVVRHGDPWLASSPAGRRVPLSRLLDGAPGVVAFLAGCHEDVDALQRLTDRLARPAAAPVPVVVIGVLSDPALPARLRACGLQGPVYGDPEGEARVAFRTTGVPQYFVLGADGRVRFEDVRLAEVPRQLLALAPAGRPPTAE